MDTISVSINIILMLMIERVTVVSVFLGDQLFQYFSPLTLDRIPKPLNMQLKWQMQLQRFTFYIVSFAWGMEGRLPTLVLSIDP